MQQARLGKINRRLSARSRCRYEALQERLSGRRHRQFPECLYAPPIHREPGSGSVFLSRTHDGELARQVRSHLVPDGRKIGMFTQLRRVWTQLDL